MRGGFFKSINIFEKSSVIKSRRNELINKVNVMKNIVMAMSLFTLLNVVNESAAMNSSFGKSFPAYDEVKHAIGFYSIKKVQGEDINKNEEDRHALFCYAIQKGVNSVVEELISQGVDIIHEQDEDGREALHYAVCANSVSMVNLLFKRGPTLMLKVNGERPFIMQFGRDWMRW